MGQKSHFNEDFMAVKTVNAYGKISVTDKAIALVVAHTALESYGVVDLFSRLREHVREMFSRQNKARGIKVLTIGDRIHIDIDIILKYGVSINAVAETVRKQVKYNVEKFTGMIVDSVNINVMGVRV